MKKSILAAIIAIFVSCSVVWAGWVEDAHNYNKTNQKIAMAIVKENLAKATIADARKFFELGDEKLAVKVSVAIADSIYKKSSSADKAESQFYIGRYWIKQGESMGIKNFEVAVANAPGKYDKMISALLVERAQQYQKEGREGRAKVFLEEAKKFKPSIDANKPSAPVMGITITDANLDKSGELLIMYSKFKLQPGDRLLYKAVVPEGEGPVLTKDSEAWNPIPSNEYVVVSNFVPDTKLLKIPKGKGIVIKLRIERGSGDSSFAMN